jgi:hypothetical protein
MGEYPVCRQGIVVEGYFIDAGSTSSNAGRIRTA